MKFISDAGKQNGLYWESPEGHRKARSGHWRHLHRRRI